MTPTPDTDELINAALDAEERDLLRRIGEEPPYLSQALGLFRGRTGWVNAILMLSQAFLFLFGVFAAVQFFRAETSLAALQWGLPASVAILSAITIKMALLPGMQTNRLIAELRRIEAELIITRRAP